MDKMTTFISLFPDVVWAAVIASLLTILGVLFTNRGNYDRLIKELSHNSKQRDKDREMGLRREIYLEATESLTEIHMILTKLSDLNYKYSELADKFSEASSSISKTYIIGNNDTVKAITQLSTIISTKFLELSSQRFPLMQKQEEIKTEYQLLSKAASERDAMIKLMRDFSLQGSKDKNLFETISRNYEFDKKNCNEHLDKIGKLETQNNQDQLKLALSCNKASKEVSKYFTPAISAVRKEMEIPFNANEYQEIMEEAWNVSEKAISEFIENLPEKKDIKSS